MGVESFGAPKREGKKSFVGRQTVNGVDIIVEWDDGYQDYVILLPQIEIGDKSHGLGVPDQLIRINEDPELAKKIFEYACEAAQKESDVYKLFLNFEDYIYEKRMEPSDASSLNEHDPLGVEAHEKERDVRIEKIKAKLEHLHTHEMDAILALIDGFEAQSK